MSLSRKHVLKCSGFICTLALLSPLLKTNLSNFPWYGALWESPTLCRGTQCRRLSRHPLPGEWHLWKSQCTVCSLFFLTHVSRLIPFIMFLSVLFRCRNWWLYEQGMLSLWAAMCVPVLRSNGIAFSIRLSQLAFQCCFILTKCLSLPQLFLITLKCLAACLLYQRNQVNTTQSLCLEHLLCSGPLLWELRSWIRPGSHHQGSPSFPSFLDGFRIQEY